MQKEGFVTGREETKTLVSSIQMMRWADHWAVSYNTFCYLDVNLFVQSQPVEVACEKFKDGFPGQRLTARGLLTTTAGKSRLSVSMHILYFEQM